MAQGKLVDAEVFNAGVDRTSLESNSSVSTTSLVFERIDERLRHGPSGMSEKRPPRKYPSHDHDTLSDLDDEDPLKEESSHDLETGPFLGGAAAAGAAGGVKGMDRGLRKVLIVASALFVAAWVAGLLVYVTSKSYQHTSKVDHDPQATVSRGTGKKITMDQLHSGFWRPRQHDISWIAGPGGEDGLLLETGAEGKDYLVVEDVRGQESEQVAAQSSRTLMKQGQFEYGGRVRQPDDAVPSRDLRKVLLATESQKNWRWSTVAKYWIFDVASQKAEPLVPDEPDARVQLAQWSPTSDSIAFTMDNNLYLRKLGESRVVQITKDGGPEFFHGIPDWVYEEEVLGGGSATWWSEDGQHIAFLTTNETGVPEYPIAFHVSRPSGQKPKPGEEGYPEIQKLKYPKAGAHNPVVSVRFYDVALGDVFSVDIEGGFADDDRLVTTLVWAGKQVIVKETNRISDVMRVVLVDVESRTGKTVRSVDVGKIDGGWFEISQKTRYIPADPARGRPKDGYIDTVIHDNGDHLAYFTPPDNPDPIMLTSGAWEVVDAPEAVDLDKNLVYFVATKESSVQRHIYSVKLDGSGLTAFTDTKAEGYYSGSFSSGAGYALLTYSGPGIPWQKVLSTPGNDIRYEHVVEENKELADSAKKHELPLLVYGTLEVEGGVRLNYVERRPPHFNPSRKYPVLFFQYSGPGSQSVSKAFRVDFQSYVAASLGYVVVTVDGRGTGFIGRGARVVVRGRLGLAEARDQIAAGRRWAGLGYVDASRLAIWGWSYGGFMALKTLEQDAGATFSYGMAVAPVTDWRFYDSVYTERYMSTPQLNAAGYDASAVANVSALGESVRFLLVHGSADDNVHFQNSLTLLDRLDLAGVENYDVHVFPDSNHGIYFHNANRVVYDKLSNWLVNAFNGEWLKVNQAKPVEITAKEKKE
ncbi:uncharacterized protein E0L32_004237 [Thyridium curvatum]|uniref:Probable dipeptidyl-aminopeptidase B n=1 Tax=Thyridium curvatum TaxID=1093900 RepID=A0A507BDV4_9PEZI|nr:uncharacterized protein E0L32_004237 [Thyridium curvatum]TPX15539.1 hypothetical protein E0L32_004237 [Thyridium curvatum]